jgi:sugar lactone lactonase YvrE
VILAASAACAHAPGRLLPDVAWPPAPAPARLRLVGVFPDPGAPAPSRSAWRILLEAITGAEPDERPESWLARPFGVAAGEGGAFVIADPDRPSVVRVDGHGSASRVACRGREWRAPMAAAYGRDGALYVADGAAAEIVRVATDGSCRALGAGALERPVGLVVDGDRLFVVDPPRHEVVVLSSSGEALTRFGGQGEGDGQLHFPTAIALARDGTLLVVDALNFRIARFATDGRWLGAFGAAGNSDGALARPKGIAVDQAGHVYVSDAQRDALLVFSADGTFESALGDSGGEPGQVTMPAGLAVSGGKLYLADSQNQRVQVFEIPGGSP